MWYAVDMAVKAEKPKLWALRLYKRQFQIVRALARKEKVSQAEIGRRAIEQYVV